MPILLDCPNCQRLHLKDKMAGKTVVCPKCGVELAVPAAPSESPPLPYGPAPTADRAAVEWSAATASGERLGPTVPTLFAQWIAEGRISAECLVWRTGWPAWRRADEAAAELPAPLPAAVVGTASGATPAEPAPVVPSLTAPAPAARGTSYTARKRQQARRRRLFTLGLAVACLLLAAMLVVMIVR